jgi:predicted phosphodiesterase
VRKQIKKDKPDVVLVAGDLVMNGPEPGGTLDALREMERDGAIIVQGNTDVAVADADYAAAFPGMIESGVGPRRA